MAEQGRIEILLHGGTGRMGQAIIALAPSMAVGVRGFLDFRPGAAKALDGTPIVRHISDAGGRVDAVVDFSHPDALGPLVAGLQGSGVPLVSGTTGLGENERRVLERYSQEAAVLYDENMSYGVSVLKKLLRIAAPLWKDAADVEIVEIHRRGKRDFPSGTAYALARVIDPEARLVSGRKAEASAKTRVIHGHSVRVGGVVGEHEIIFGTEDEVMTIAHRALSRAAFARGALRAVRFVVGRSPGMYSMDDVVGA